MNNYNLTNPNNVTNHVYVSQPTLPDKKKLNTQETEKIIENNIVSNSNMYIQTNVNNFTQNEINKPNKFQVNQTNYKFIETLNNNNDRNNTVQANLNTVVQMTNNDLKNSKLHTSQNKSM